jgi:hypothetical protein
LPVVGWWPGDDTVSDLTVNANNAPGTVSLPLDIRVYRVGGFGWNGRIDELEVYNRVLSAAEAAANYEAGSAGQCKLVLGGTDAGSFNRESGGTMVFPREFEVNAVVFVRLFLSQYVALSWPDSQALPFGHNTAGDCISPRGKSVADLPA